jgi:hypothetical protein
VIDCDGVAADEQDGCEWVRVFEPLNCKIEIEYH